MKILIVIDGVESEFTDIEEASLYMQTCAYQYSAEQDAKDEC